MKIWRVKVRKAGSTRPETIGYFATRPEAEYFIRQNRKYKIGKAWREPLLLIPSKSGIAKLLNQLT